MVRANTGSSTIATGTPLGSPSPRCTIGPFCTGNLCCTLRDTAHPALRKRSTASWCSRFFRSWPFTERILSPSWSRPSWAAAPSSLIRLTCPRGSPPCSSPSPLPSSYRSWCSGSGCGLWWLLHTSHTPCCRDGCCMSPSPPFSSP